MLSQKMRLLKPQSMVGRSFAEKSQSTAVVSCDETISRLSRILLTEYEHEQGFLKDVTIGPEELPRLGFRRADTEDNAQIVLRKRVGGNEIEISYSAKDQEIVPEIEGEEVNGDSALVVPFIIKVRTKRGSGLVFDCDTSRQEIKIYRVMKLEDYEKYVELPTHEKRNLEYLGPCFPNLGDKVQDGFTKLLESMGINEDVLEYIEKSAVEKEQKLYLRWIDNIKGAIKDIC